jgi:hypothetical protein
MTVVATKPAVRDAWADQAANPADIVDPGNAFAATGWPLSSTPPPRQYFNWILNWVANAVRYFCQRGVVDYDPAELYQQYAIVRGDNNCLFQSLINSNTGNTPSTSPAAWGPVNAYPRTAQEIAAGVTPVSTAYPTSPRHDGRRYGYVGNWNQTAQTGADDTAAFAQMALVMGAGGSVCVPPSSTLMTSQVTWPPAAVGVSLTGYGVAVYTKNAIDAFRMFAFSGAGMTIKGFAVYQTDSMATSAFNQQGLHSCVDDCTVFISSTVAPFAGYAACLISSSNIANPADLPLWNNVDRLKVQQIGGGNPATVAPFGILIQGECNVVRIDRSDIQNVSYGVGLYNVTASAVPTALPSNVTISRTSFDGIAQFGILVNGQSVANSNINGLTVSGCYFESCAGGAYRFQGLGIDSFTPTLLTGNTYLSSVAAYINQGNVGGLQVTVNTWEPSFIPNFGSGSGATTDMTNAGSFNFTNIGSTDGVVVGVQSTGAGILLQTAQGAALAALRYKPGGGAYLMGTAGIGIGTLGTPITQKLKGTQAMSGTTVAVSFGVTLSGSAYQISLCSNLQGGPFWATNKTTTGFTINSGGSFTGNVDWIIEQ